MSRIYIEPKKEQFENYIVLKVGIHLEWYILIKVFFILGWHKTLNHHKVETLSGFVYSAFHSYKAIFSRNVLRHGLFHTHYFL